MIQHDTAERAKPLLAVTLGDPAGVGPETIVAAWSEPAVHVCCRPLVVGQPEIVRRAVSLLNNTARVVPIDAPQQADSSPQTIPCITAGSTDSLDVRPGAVDARGGQAAYDALVLAARLALEGQVDAITTGPLNKAALAQAGHKYPGHTELLAELCGVRDFAMMLYLGPRSGVGGPAGLGVIHVTLHTALRKVFEQLSANAILEKIQLANAAFLALKGGRPRIGVAALNPHAGEDGLFGDEEQSIIAPAVARGRAAGLDVQGPLPVDTLMVRVRDGEFDAVVAMYHDQGHIALKLLDMHHAVNVTLGLPIVRTSVAHGTAFDLAWQGRAQHTSMVEAMRVAAELAARCGIGERSEGGGQNAETSNQQLEIRSGRL